MLCKTNPFHFFQLANARLPIGRECSSLVREYKYQAGAGLAGRENIRQAILRAESMIQNELGYPIAPTWMCEQVAWTGWGDVQLKAKNIHRIGREVLSPLGDFPVALSDLDRDGIKEMFSVVVPLSVLPADFSIGDEVSLFFSFADRWDTSLPMDSYEIRPVSSVIDPAKGILTINGHSWLAVRPVLYQGFPLPNASGQLHLDIDNEDNFAGSMSVYRRQMDHRLSGRSDWVARSESCSSSDGPDGCTHCSSMDFCLIDGEHGIVRPRWNGCTCGNHPERLNISFQAGSCLNDWENVIARLACAELACAVCGCQDSCLEYWLEDLSMTNSRSKDGNTHFDRKTLTNPWGTRRGHIYAWKFIMENRKVEGVSL